MEEKQHDIIEVCRRRKEEFRLPLPVDGWERLEAEEKPARRRSVWWRWLAAAALLAGITFSGWWLWQMPEVEPLPEEVVTESVPEEVRPIIPEVEVLPLSYLSVPKEEISLHSVAIPEEKKESISEEPEIVSSSEETEETEEAMPETSVWTLPEEEQPRRRKGSWSFGLAAGGSGAMNLSLASADRRLANPRLVGCIGHTGAVIRLSSSSADLVWIVGTLCLETGFGHRNGIDIHLALFVVTFGKLPDG